MHYHPKPVLLMCFIVSWLLIFCRLITWAQGCYNKRFYTINYNLINNYFSSHTNALAPNIAASDSFK